MPEKKERTHPNANTMFQNFECSSNSLYHFSIHKVYSHVASLFGVMKNNFSAFL